MKKGKTILWLGVMLGCLICGCARKAAVDFFRPAPERAREYAPDKIYPQGRLFPFSVIGGRVGRDKKHNFTMIGHSGTMTIEGQIALDVGEHGLKIIAKVGVSKEDVRATGEGSVSVDELVEKVREQVKGLMHNETIAWWSLMPNELRPWRRREMEYLEKAAVVIRDTDPLKRPVWMYDPGHRSAAGLAPTARYLDIVGKGMYVNYSGMRDARIWCRWTIEQEKQAIAQANPGAIPIAVPEMFQQPDPEHAALIPAWVRHDVYLALVSGAKGVVVFSFWRRPNFPAYSDYYAAYVQLAQELCGEMNLGQVFLFGEWRDDISVKVVKGPATVEMVFPSGGVKEPLKYSSVSYANIAWGRERYLFMVNSANEPISVKAGPFPCRNTCARSIFDNQLPFLAPENGFEVNLPPLMVKCFRFTQEQK